jgi:glucose-1-phosphate adenylyltransferase
VHSHASVDWSVVMPNVQIGRRVRLNRTVIDRACVIPDDMVIGENPEFDALHFHRTESGVTLVTRDMLERIGK